MSKSVHKMYVLVFYNVKTILPTAMPTVYASYSEACDARRREKTPEGFVICRLERHWLDHP